MQLNRFCWIKTLALCFCSGSKLLVGKKVSSSINENTGNKQITGKTHDVPERKTRRKKRILTPGGGGGGWSGGAKVLGKLPVPGRPTILITVGQGPTALAVGAVGVVWTFLLSSILSLLFLPLFGRRPDID